MSRHLSQQQQQDDDKFATLRSCAMKMFQERTKDLTQVTALAQRTDEFEARVGTMQTTAAKVKVYRALLEAQVEADAARNAQRAAALREVEALYRDVSRHDGRFREVHADAAAFGAGASRAATSFTSNTDAAADADDANPGNSNLIATRMADAERLCNGLTASDFRSVEADLVQKAATMEGALTQWTSAFASTTAAAIGVDRATLAVVAPPEWTETVRAWVSGYQTAPALDLAGAAVASFDAPTLRAHLSFIESGALVPPGFFLSSYQTAGETDGEGECSATANEHDGEQQAALHTGLTELLAKLSGAAAGSGGGAAVAAVADELRASIFAVEGLCASVAATDEAKEHAAAAMNAAGVSDDETAAAALRVEAQREHLRAAQEKIGADGTTAAAACEEADAKEAASAAEVAQLEECNARTASLLAEAEQCSAEFAAASEGTAALVARETDATATSNDAAAAAEEECAKLEAEVVSEQHGEEGAEAAAAAAPTVVALRAAAEQLREYSYTAQRTLRGIRSPAEIGAVTSLPAKAPQLGAEVDEFVAAVCPLPPTTSTNADANNTDGEQPEATTAASGSKGKKKKKTTKASQKSKTRNSSCSDDNGNLAAADASCALAAAELEEAPLFKEVMLQLESVGADCGVKVAENEQRVKDSVRRTETKDAMDNMPPGMQHAAANAAH